MIVVDSSVLIDHLRGDPRARRFLAETFHARGDQLAASVLTKVEVLAGMLPGEEETTHAFLDLFAWIPVDDQVADRAGQLAFRYHRSHPGVDPVDFVTAATVEMLEAELWTRNLKHFPMLTSARDPYRT